MAQIGIGDLAQSRLLWRQTAEAKSQLTQLGTDLTTGVAGDTVRHLSGNLSQIAALDASLARLSAYGTATAELAQQATAQQSALAVIAGLASQGADALLPAKGTVSATQVDAAAQTAHSAFETMVSTLNTRFGDRALFAGQASSQAALAPAEAMLTAIEAATAGATTAEAVQAAVAAWFSDPAGFADSGYLGGPSATAIPVADGETIALTTTASDPALRDVLQGLAIGALLGRGQFAGQDDLRRTLAGQAGEGLTAARTGLTYLQGQLGMDEARIEAAATRNTAEETTLGLARNDLVAIDAYEVSTRLQDAESRLELIYTLTARMQRLSLVEYL